MKISKFPDPSEFVIKEVTISNTLCKLVFPKNIKTVWTNENKIFRSSVWSNDGYLISASYKKFTNLGETPEFEPLDLSGNLEYITKIDGSTLCISKFKDNLIIRTRGTVDASLMENGNEIEQLKSMYPLLFDNELLNTENYSILCEWYSPKNIIIERESSGPTLWLTGVVRHEDYSYFRQTELNELGYRWSVPRPAMFFFKNIQEMTANVKPWLKGEGVIICGNNGQTLKKFKADRYLLLHKLASQLNNINALIEMYVENNLPSLEDFQCIIKKEFDFELASEIFSDMEKVCVIGETYKKFLDNVNSVINDLRSLQSRKEIAQHLTRVFGANASYAFSVLDKKEITKEQIIKFIKKTNQQYS